MSNEKNTLSAINKKMESIRKLEEKIKEQILKFETPKFKMKDVFEKNNKLISAFKNDDLNTLNETIRTMPTSSSISINKRSRAERREDFESEILKIDQEKIKLLIDAWEKVEGNEKITLYDVQDLTENTIDALIKYQRTIGTFKELNSNLAVQLDYKKNELVFVAKADWKNKFRLFFFRILWTLLFIISLFAVGYIEQKYEWAHLPMSKYFNAKIAK